MDLDDAAAAATKSSQAMARELSGRIGVKRLILLWETHQDDVRRYIEALNAAHKSAGSKLT